METGRLLKISFNDRLIDKNAPVDTKYFAEGFDPCEATLDEFETVVTSGVAFSYQFKNGYRRSEYFQATDVLAVDVDGGISIDDCLLIPIVEKYGSFFYTTPSHNSDHHRFRLVFVLPRTITDPNELRFATKALAQRLGGDLAATDAARMFYGSSNSVHIQLGSEVSHDFLNELIEDGRVVVSSDKIGKTGPTANRSALKVPPTLEITLADGTACAFREIDDKRPVYCPFHQDTWPSAFIAQTARGSFLHCADCQKTWWMAGSMVPDFDFNDFDAWVKTIKEGVLHRDPSTLVGLEEFIDCPVVDPKNILIQSERYINEKHIKDWDLSKGVTFVKSPKGSGKTTFLQGLLKQATVRFATLEEFEEEADPEEPAPWFTNEKVLLIGHRQALIGEMCQKLQLNCYLEDRKDASRPLLNERKKRYGVCLDSLRRVENQIYDIVVIDEVEQVLGHFLSETIGEARGRIFQIFARLIRSARQVIVLDADLGWLSFKTIQLIKSLPVDAVPQHKQLAKKEVLRICINEWRDVSRSLNIYENQNHLIQQFKVAVLAGERVFVSSNSKKKINALEQMVRKLAKDAGIDIPCVSITSTNSKSQKIQELIRDITTQILNYQVILSSPSLGTGVDITFKNGAQEIDRVFGFFEARVTSHFEIDQQLARVRNPRQIDVWISPQWFNFETEFEVIVDDMVRSDLVSTVQYGFQWANRTTLAEKDPFLAMAALMTAKSRASKNNLKANFVQYKNDQGWAVHSINKIKTLASEGFALLEEGKRLSLKEEIDSILAAKVLNRDDFEQLKQRIELQTDIVTIDERYCLERTYLELFYREEATAALIAWDNFGEKRHKLLRFEDLMAVPDLKGRFKKNIERDGNKKLTRASVELIKDREVGAALLFDIFETTPAFKKGIFQPDVIYSSCDFGEFVKISRSVKRFVEGQFDVATRKDLERKPIQHFDSLLKLVGLKNCTAGTKKENGKKVYFYRISRDKFDAMENFAERRKQTTGWDYLNEKYDSESWRRAAN